MIKILLSPPKNLNSYILIIFSFKLAVTLIESATSFLSNLTKCLNFDDFCSVSTQISTKLEHADTNEKIQAAREIINLKKTKKIYDSAWNSTITQPFENVVELVNKAEIGTAEMCPKTLQELKDCLKQSRSEMANDTMSSFAKASAILIATEVVFLFKTWEEIKLAENIIKNEELFNDIDQHIKKLGLDLKELEEQIDQSEFDDARETLSILSICYSDTINLLNRVELRGSLQSLNLMYKDSIRGTVSNGIQTVSAITNLIRLGADMSAWNKFFGFVMASGFALLTSYHWENAVLSEKRVSEIKDKIKEFDKREQELRRIGALIQEARSYLKVKRNANKLF